MSNLFAKLDTIKKTVLDDDDYFKADADDENDIAILERDNNKSKKVGIFSLKSKSADVKVDLPDGDYKNEISGETVAVSNGKIQSTYIFSVHIKVITQSSFICKTAFFYDTL